MSTDFYSVVIGDRAGVVCVAFGRQPFRDENGGYKFGEWQQLRYPWPTDRARLLADIEREMALGEAVDTFTCPAVRHSGAKGRRKGDALPPLVVWADLDDQPKDPELFARLVDLGAFLVKSGSANHQHVYLPLTRPVDLGTHARLGQELSKRLGGDSKWSDESLLRPPGSYNYKATCPPDGQPAGPRVLVEATGWNGKRVDPDELAALLGVAVSNHATSNNQATSDTSTLTPEPLPTVLSSKVLEALGHPDVEDRSKACARLISACALAGMTPGQTLTALRAYGPAERYKNEQHRVDDIFRVRLKVFRDRAEQTTTREQPSSGSDDDGEISVVPFPTMPSAALFGLPGEVVEAVLPHTEAHAAPILAQLLALFGCTVGAGPHVRIDNREHPARINPLVIGKTSDGAKGTSYGVVGALFTELEKLVVGGTLRRGVLRSVRSLDPLRRLSGLSSGEGLIEAVRDGNGLDPDHRDFDEGIIDKRLERVS